MQDGCAFDADGIAEKFERLSATPPLRVETSRELTAAVLGAGARGRTYAGYGRLFPGTMRVTAVADVNAWRRDAMGAEWDVPAERRFGDFRELLAAGAKGRLADIAIVSLPDHLHWEAGMEAMAQGYDVLLEKPMAQTEEQCRDLLRRQRETGAMAALGHVLRYSPYFRAVKAMLDGGLAGELVNVQHQEPVEWVHMSHSFVRGNWHDSKASTPMIVAKCCHDMDILRWWTGRRCLRVSAEGGLHLFKRENAPAGSAGRCTSCPLENSCRFSATRIYRRGSPWLHVLDLPADFTPEDVRRKLDTCDYGRCVYRMDNDQPDHIVASLLFEGGVTASFSMDAFAPRGGRRSRLMGTEGYIEGDGTSFSLWRFDSGRRFDWTFKPAGEGDYAQNGHSGGDLMLIRDFIAAADTRDFSKLSSDFGSSVESHLMAFACERSRLGGETVRVEV